MITRLLKCCRILWSPAVPAVGTCLWAIIFFLYTAGMAQGQATNDPLKIPAEKTTVKRLLKSILLDVVHTGERLVAVGERGHILYSGDNGLTWVQARVPVSVTLTAVYFPTQRHGWAVGHDGIVLHSCDGGRSWAVQLDGNQVNTLVVEHLSQLVGSKKSRTGPLDLDALKFLLSDASIALKEGPTRPFMDVWFKNEREGLVIGAFGLILKTLDGGATWRPIYEQMDNPDGFHYYGIARAGSSLFIAGEGGMLFRSRDGGNTWNRQTSPYVGSFFGIVGHPAGNFVMAFGMEGKLFCSTDMGATWEPVKLNSRTSLSGGTVLPDGAVVISGINGSLFYRKSGKDAFSSLPFKFPGCMAVSHTQSHGILLTGLNGLERTTISNTR